MTVFPKFRFWLGLHPSHGSDYRPGIYGLPGLIFSNFVWSWSGPRFWKMAIPVRDGPGLRKFSWSWADRFWSVDSWLPVEMGRKLVIVFFSVLSVSNAFYREWRTGKWFIYSQWIKLVVLVFLIFWPFSVWHITRPQEWSKHEWSWTGLTPIRESWKKNPKTGNWASVIFGKKIHEL